MVSKVKRVKRNMIMILSPIDYDFSKIEIVRSEKEEVKTSVDLDC